MRFGHIAVFVRLGHAPRRKGQAVAIKGIAFSPGTLLSVPEPGDASQAFLPIAARTRFLSQ
jgi:hypothetical protein